VGAREETKVEVKLEAAPTVEAQAHLQVLRKLLQIQAPVEVRMEVALSMESQHHPVLSQQRLQPHLRQTYRTSQQWHLYILSQHPHPRKLSLRLLFSH